MPQGNAAFTVRGLSLLLSWADISDQSTHSIEEEATKTKVDPEAKYIDWIWSRHLEEQVQQRIESLVLTVDVEEVNDWFSQNAVEDGIGDDGHNGTEDEENVCIRKALHVFLEIWFSHSNAESTKARKTCMSDEAMEAEEDIRHVEDGRRLNEIEGCGCHGEIGYIVVGCSLGSFCLEERPQRKNVDWHGTDLERNLRKVIAAFPDCQIDLLQDFQNEKRDTKSEENLVDNLLVFLVAVFSAQDDTTDNRAEHDKDGEDMNEAPGWKWGSGPLWKHCILLFFYQ